MVEPPRNPFLMLASVFGAFGAGPLLGVLVGHLTAPGSELVQVVSPLAFAATFAGGLALWLGLEIVAVGTAAVRRVLRGSGGWRQRGGGPPTRVPPGCGVFLPLGIVFGLAAGVVAGVVPQSTSFLFASAAHVAVGAAYGFALRALARLGFLPSPEPG